VRAALLLVASLSACGAAVEPVVDSGVPCVATFSGNFEDQSTSSYSCPRVSAVTGGWAFTAKVAAPSAGSTLTVSIPLGTTVGASSWTSADPKGEWQATAARDPGCVYVAGTHATPTGGFSLQLSSVDLATGVVHGRLELEQSLHALPAFACGPGDAESVVLTF
jgi:hypothetical protein